MEIFNFINIKGNCMIVILLYLLSFILIWQFVGYPLLMAALSISSKPMEKDYSFKPFISIIIPTYNEESMIIKRINNLLNLDYPKDMYEIIIVDSASKDKTSELVENIIADRVSLKPEVSLIREKQRNGIATAINLGRDAGKGSIALVTTANSTFNLNALKEISPHFKNKNIGGVGGRYCVSNPQNPLTESESFYWDLEYIMRMGESIIDSACLFHGEIYAWRRELFKADRDLLADDLNMAIQIRRAGYKVEYEPNAVAYEMGASILEDQISQRKRTSIGTIDCIFKHWKYFAVPIDMYRLIIFPSHKMLALLFPFILISILSIYLFISDINTIMVHILVSTIIFGLLLLLLMHLKSKLIKRSVITSKLSHFSLANTMFYVLLNAWVLILAWKDYLLKNYSVIYTKVESTRLGGGN